MMVNIYTSTYRYSGSDRMDITVKGHGKYKKYFAPTWDMVNAYKAGVLSIKDYTVQYERRLMAVPDFIWDQILQMDRVTLVCFCKAGDFCHRLLLVEALTTRGGVYNGER